MSNFPWKTMIVGAAILAATVYAYAQFSLSANGPMGMHGQMSQGGMAQMHQQMMQGQGGNMGQGMHDGMQGGMGMHGGMGGHDDWQARIRFAQPFFHQTRDACFDTFEQFLDIYGAGFDGCH